MRELYDDDVFYPRENYPANPVINMLNINFTVASLFPKEKRGHN